MDTGLDCGPDEAGVFLVQLYYYILSVFSDKFDKFNYLLYLVNKCQTKHDTIYQLKLRFEQFLEICPVIDLVMPILSSDSIITWTNKCEEKEEISTFIKQIIDKIQFMEKPMIYRIHNVKIERLHERCTIACIPK